MTENSQEYQDWYELHESKCTINHSGSSEVAGALVLCYGVVVFLDLIDEFEYDIRIIISRRLDLREATFVVANWLPSRVV